MKPANGLAWRGVLRALFFALLAVLVFMLAARAVRHGPENMFAVSPASQVGVPAAAVPSPFVYEFKDDGILHESSSSETSSSPYWWVDSGGKLIVENGVGKTLHGALAVSDRWRTRYALSNSEDTDRGAYPQNLFRLLTRSQWDDVRAEVSFKITADNFIDTPNRNESNGLLLMSRYQDGDNLYYAGIRVDGHAVIKKKSGGTYYTMAEKQIFPGSYKNGDKKNLLPHNEWLHLRMETTTQNGAVTIKLFMRENDEKEWAELLTASDDKKPITGSHPLGIRTDFMDVEFDDFRAEKI